jgi:acyl-CoA thioesterase FadM
LIRILETQRWFAFDKNGFGKAYFRKGVIRAQYLEVFETTRFDEKIEVSICLFRVGRSSMDFSHKIHSSVTGQLVGHAAVRFVALDADFRLQKLPPQVRDYLSDPEGIDIPTTVYEKPQNAWSHAFTVQWADLDFMQHVNEARFIEYIENTRHACAAAGGFGIHDDRALFPIGRLAISYDDQARLGERLNTAVWQIEKEPNRFAFEIRRESDQALVTRAWIEVRETDPIAINRIRSGL